MKEVRESKNINKLLVKAEKVGFEFILKTVNRRVANHSISQDMLWSPRRLKQCSGKQRCSLWSVGH